jgi:hypothetical protein
MVRAQIAMAAPCATARSIWVSVVLGGSSLIALSCAFLRSPREIPHSSWRFPARALLLAGTPHPGRPKKCRVRNLFDQWLKLADGVCIEIEHPTTNTLPTRMISTNHDPVAKRKKNSSVSSRHSWPVENLQIEERKFPAANVAPSFPPLRRGGQGGCIPAAAITKPSRNRTRRIVRSAIRQYGALFIRPRHPSPSDPNRAWYHGLARTRAKRRHAAHFALRATKKPRRSPRRNARR